MHKKLYKTILTNLANNSGKIFGLTSLSGDNVQNSKNELYVNCYGWSYYTWAYEYLHWLTTSNALAIKAFTV